MDILNFDLSKSASINTNFEISNNSLKWTDNFFDYSQNLNPKNNCLSVQSRYLVDRLDPRYL